jgi:hypothetical protein
METVVIGIAAIVAILSGMFVAFRAAQPKRQPPKLPPQPEPIVKVLRDIEQDEASARTEKHAGQYDEVKLDAAKPPAARDQANADWLNSRGRK